jgi:hypothetical protein
LAEWATSAAEGSGAPNRSGRRSVSLGMRGRIGTPLALGATAIALGVLAPLTASASHPRHTKPQLTKSAHVAYENCSPKTTILKASINKLSFGLTETVIVHTTLTNTSGVQCGYEATEPPSVTQPRQLVVGPCGPIGLQVDNAKGVDVYPGPVAFSCPAEFPASLPAHGTVSGNGEWDHEQYKVYNGLEASSGVAPEQHTGHFTLIVDGKITFPITVH